MQEKPDVDIEAQAAELLRRIGWDRSNLLQIEVYARMSPAQKVSQMLELRAQFMSLLETRLRREHPAASDLEINRLILEHLELVREH